MDLSLEHIGKGFQKIGDSFHVTHCLSCEQEKLCVKFSRIEYAICSSCLLRTPYWESLKKGKQIDRPPFFQEMKKGIEGKLFVGFRQSPPLGEDGSAELIHTLISDDEAVFLLDWDMFEGFAAVNQFISSILVATGKYEINNEGFISPKEEKTYEN